MKMWICVIALLLIPTFAASESDIIDTIVATSDETPDDWDRTGGSNDYDILSDGSDATAMTTNVDNEREGYGMAGSALTPADYLIDSVYVYIKFYNPLGVCPGCDGVRVAAILGDNPDTIWTSTLKESVPSSPAWHGEKITPAHGFWRFSDIDDLKIMLEFDGAGSETNVVAEMLVEIHARDAQEFTNVLYANNDVAPSEWNVVGGGTRVEAVAAISGGRMVETTADDREHYEMDDLSAAVEDVDSIEVFYYAKCGGFSGTTNMQTDLHLHNDTTDGANQLLACGDAYEWFSDVYTDPPDGTDDRYGWLLGHIDSLEIELNAGSPIELGEDNTVDAVYINVYGKIDAVETPPLQKNKHGPGGAALTQSIFGKSPRHSK